MARLKISGMAIVDNSGAIVGMISEGLVRRHEDHSGRQARKACPKTSERATGQRSVISPLLANIYLHYAFRPLG